MREKKDKMLEFPFIKNSNEDLRSDFHHNKKIPTKEDILARSFNSENEWQQEYYIIYNSYVLDRQEQ